MFNRGYSYCGMYHIVYASTHVALYVVTVHFLDLNIIHHI
jgi:hypothetical protein